MTQPRRGRPPRRLDPDASQAARLGAEIRTRRQARGLTLEALAALIGFSPQHISEVELAKVPPSGPFVAACDEALEAGGTLTALLPSVVCERALQRHGRASTRDRGLGSAIGLPGSAAAQPGKPAAVDPELVTHWLELKGVLTDHDQLFGPHQVFSIARRGIGIIGRHRQAARGWVRTDLMRVESRWEMLVAWLEDDAGDPKAAASMDRARALATEADDELMVAYVLVRQSERASRLGKPRQAVGLAQAARRQRSMTPEVRALAALYEALGHARGGETAACQADLWAAYEIVDQQPDGGVIDSGFEGLGRHYATRITVLAGESRCWRWLGQPRKAVDAAEGALACWPVIRRRGRGLQRAGLAVACAAAGEPDRAAREGLHAFRVARATGSERTMHELARLDERLVTAPQAQGVAEFREAFAAGR
jgi:transcriptional regulator with XRE-family HTH domain